MKPVIESCIPRTEVLESDLKDALFAANFGHVIEGDEGVAADVYSKPELFFQNTYPTATLKKVVQMIFGRLADTTEPGFAIRLSTGFGGGKTHTLIALWHLGKNVGNKTMGTELLPAAGRPHKVVTVGIDAGKFGVPICAIHGKIKTHSLWGELAYQLGNEKAYREMQEVDSPTTVPNSQMIRAMLPDAPILILLDELVIYMAALETQAQGALLSFINNLIAEISARKQAVMVITDPAGQAVYQKESAALADVTKQMKAAHDLDDVLGRQLTHFDPIGKEASKVITRRLFEHVSSDAAQVASDEYLQTFKRVAAEHPDLLPPEAAKMDYAQRIVDCYPFHPRLLETAQERLRAMPDFNLSRGTLRLFARILRDVWEKKSNIHLITAGDLDWSSDRIQADLLDRLNRDGFKAAVDSDVLRHAGQLDGDFSTDAHQRVASALMLESLPREENSAMDKREITLAVLRPSDVGHEPSEAMDRLMGLCWHTYPTGAGKYQFRYEANINKLIEERAGKVSYEDAKTRIFTLVQGYFNGQTFQLKPWPDHPQAVPDGARIKLVLCENEKLAKEICEFEDDSNPEAKRPRRFRNAIVAIAPTTDVLNTAIDVMRSLRAAEDIHKEEGGKKKSALRDDLDELLPKLKRRANFQAYRAFNRVVLQGRPPMILDEKYLISDEGALGTVNGQAKIKEFLDDKKVVFKPDESIDVNLLMELMQGATPSLESPGAFPANSVHERALASERLRLMMNEEPLRKSILHAVEQGLIVIHQKNGDTFDKDGMVTGASGARKRSPRKLQNLSLTDDNLLAPTAAPCVAGWLKEDGEISAEELITLEVAAQEKGTSLRKIQDALDTGSIHSVVQGGERRVILNDSFQRWQPDVATTVTANTWDEAIQHSANRPLQTLTLVAESPAGAGALLLCAQPFGAQNLILEVMVGGDFKEGGTFNMSLNNVKHNNAIKPIELAQKLYRASTDYGGTFDMRLTLEWNGEMSDCATKFEQAKGQAGSGLHPEAKFGAEKP